MNTFARAVNMPSATRTTNGMPALNKTGSAIVDLFYSIGSSRNNPNVGSVFARAYAEDNTLAARTLFWARDVRGGAGERQTFRNLMVQLETEDVEACKKLIPFIPEYGRWDDGFMFQTKDCKNVWMSLIAKTLQDGIKSRHVLGMIDSLSEEDCKELLKQA